MTSRSEQNKSIRKCVLFLSIGAAVIGLFFLFSPIRFGTDLYISPGYAFAQSDPETKYKELTHQNIEKYQELGEKGFKQDCMDGGVPESLCESVTKITKEEVETAQSDVTNSEPTEINGDLNAENSTSEVVTNRNWTTYTSNVFGISFDYPSSWSVDEKGNRFDSGADVSVSDDNLKFIVLKAIDRPSDDPLKPSGIAISTRMLQDEAAKDEGTTIIESADVKKYKIGGERTGTFLTKIDDGTSPFALQNIFVIHGGDGYLLGFKASTETFDEPETQDIMNKMIQSFKFLN